MRLDKLSLDRKLALLETATRFRLTPDISLEYRGASDEENADRWAIIRGGVECYNRTGDRWEHEPSPSNRSDEFKARTRYPLAEAVGIVDSREFKKYFR